ncbi:GNAT family N-acetyltransferase [Mesobacillus jeotgali]|uniref:GNAT family N-acetyltransferase n=1 Tax=Mesobacillus jeotgali TaxID=129985 RepID=A0ABY9VM42_9BACI|nr:GNAT family N-acetyltransferase [Mesobacillus jeotgali]WNF24980.1 GNAT family N-acetyltransferase [Mesobacillus jeotgali]
MDLKLTPLTSMNFSEVVREHSKDLPNLNTIKLLENKAVSETLLKIFGVLTPSGRLIGYGMHASGPWDPILKPGYAEIFIKVDQEWRNRGIGSWILSEIEGFAQKNRIRFLQTQIKETYEEELEWAKKNGFKKTGHYFESQLDISRFKKDPYSSIFEELDLSGISFTTLEDYSKDKDYEYRFWDFWWELVSDVPGMMDKPRPDNDRMIALMKDYEKKGFILAVDGERWIALSIIVREKDEIFYNSMTGVDKRYRGQGLAQAVKIKAIEFAQQNKGKYIRTHNDSINAPMLKVNKKLGYEQKPGIYGFIKQIAD